VWQILAETALEMGTTIDLPQDELRPEVDDGWMDVDNETDGLGGQDCQMVTIIR